MRSFLTGALLSFCTLLQAQPYKNVLVYAQEFGKYAPCEPGIAISLKNPAEMVAGAVLDYVFTSSDSGKTWKAEQLESRYGVYGDPCIVSDHKGRFYYFHLSSPSGEGWANPDILDRIVCQRRSRLFNTWSRGSSIGFNYPKDQDKEWAVYDPVKNRLVTTWTEFDKYGSTDPDCKSRILFSESKNRGKTWSMAAPLPAEEGNCIDESETAEGAVPAVGPSGELYAAWSLNGNLYFFQFPGNNGDQTVNTEARIITTEANWSFEIPSLGRANGMPVIKCDRSGGEYNGAIYVNWADQRNGVNDTDVWLARSTDGGKSWSKPIRVNDDKPGKHQFFTWMDVDQSTGYIYIVFYDRRNHDDEQTDVYMAVSRNGGETFENIHISETPFRPERGVFFGDYNTISAVNGVIRPIWTRMDNGKLSIWTALVNE